MTLTPTTAAFHGIGHLDLQIPILVWPAVRLELSIEGNPDIKFCLRCPPRDAQ